MQYRSFSHRALIFGDRCWRLGSSSDGAELGVMVEVPARELRRRDAARDRVGVAEQPFEARAPAGEHGVVHHLVEQHGEVEHREALHEGQRDPERGVRHAHQGPRDEPEQDELAHGHREVARRLPAVPVADEVLRHGRGEVGTERRRVRRVVAALAHRSSTPGPRPVRPETRMGRSGDGTPRSIGAARRRPTSC